MNAMNFDSDWDFYDDYLIEKARKEAQDEHNADYADSPSCANEYDD